jgi:hypothetical protein
MQHEKNVAEMVRNFVLTYIIPKQRPSIQHQLMKLHTKFCNIPVSDDEKRSGLLSSMSELVDRGTGKNSPPTTGPKAA